MPPRKVSRVETMHHDERRDANAEPASQDLVAPTTPDPTPDHAKTRHPHVSETPPGTARPNSRTSMDRDELAVLLEHAAAGDPQAWEQLVSAFTPRVYGLLFKSCRDAELSQELTQVTFVKLVQKLDRFAGYEERGKFEPWLFRVALNALRDEMRRRGRQASTIDMSPSAASGSSDAPSAWVAAQSHLQAGSPGPAAGEDPLLIAERNELIVHLQQAVAELPEADREILHLRHTAGLTFAQIAETLDQPLGTVLARGHRAVKKLRATLEHIVNNP